MDIVMVFTADSDGFNPVYLEPCIASLYNLSENTLISEELSEQVRIVNSHHLDTVKMLLKLHEDIQQNKAHIPTEIGRKAYN
jgi:hypothetical protein